jgi:type IV secretion system protein VirD4
MTPDEVRKMDNKKCLIFIRGFDPILDNKYNPFKHPVFAQTADGEGAPYEHEPSAEGESAEPGFTILNKKSLAYYEGLKEKGEPVYIDTIPYEDFMLLGQVDMEKRFTDLDEQEQRDRLNGEMEPGLELEYAFDMEDETADSSGENAGMPESFVIGEAGTEKPPADREDKAADSISYRMFHWKFSVEQKEEVKRAMAVRVPKEVILSYFYPETSVVRMMEIRRRYE